MAARIIDGKRLAERIQDDLARDAALLRERGVTPRLEVVLVGDDPASQTYVASKVRTARKLGIESNDHIFPAGSAIEEIVDLVKRLSADPAVHGILLQSPFPHPLDYNTALMEVHPDKDVDGLHPLNAGRLVAGGTLMPPCTPAGVMELLRSEGVDPKGLGAVVVGRSMLVGKPVAHLLLAAHATVTIAHSRTRDLPGVCRGADILVAAIGRPRMITVDYVKPGAVVVDVGMNRTPEGLCGDVDFESVRSVAGALTPAPGGVGPMTITMLMRNTLTAARQRLKT